MPLDIKVTVIWYTETSDILGVKRNTLFLYTVKALPPPRSILTLMFALGSSHFIVGNLYIKRLSTKAV
jgi:hypothetical protein